jgi:hypothetical protein
MTEADELAACLTLPPGIKSFDGCSAFVREQMPDLSAVMRDNVAEALWRPLRPKLKPRAAAWGVWS